MLATTMIRPSTETRRFPGRRGTLVLSLGLISQFCLAPLGAQGVDSLPFAVGERLEYQVRLSRVRASGRSVMTVECDSVRGQLAYLLRFDFSAGFGPIRASDRTESWVDPTRLVALRFQKREQHPFWSGQEAVELFPDEHRWEGLGGTTGETATAVPLDELSFIYFLRTLPLVDDSVYAFDRHYAADRNPITVKMVGRDTIPTGVGELATIVVELRVRDPRRYKDGVGLIRIHLTDDVRRIPARIESDIPVVGKAVMTLRAWSDSASGKP